ncbi:MAG: PAS domain-containing sensor histidine kinase [Candidatus Liberibacter europaeus]|uniref:histidine kinase n=1 Tax=Candidatus Liberibacter europaeus TaxID=744859 RepID=A0A2T4VYS3_9HYPH|nr:PAS domain-containing sensor histidine kinase [Candidatus Liberibacter europaeus]PTL86916.1 MAG: PAS domain-containing sensor histidine kinase [Candidatus Liberibacter europaeus]
MSFDSINSKTNNILTNNCKNNEHNLPIRETKDRLNTKNYTTENDSKKECLKELSPVDEEKNLGVNICCSTNTYESKNTFLFDPKPRTIRFTWKIDSDGYIFEISKELSQTIGPYVLRIIGIKFCDINNLLHIDPTECLYEILKQQNTWYGKTTFWPIEGTDLIVPIDLSALPMYSRNHEFQGFKGLGIIHVDKYSNDPNQLGKILESILSTLNNNETRNDLVQKDDSALSNYKEIPFCNTISHDIAKEKNITENHMSKRYKVCLSENFDIQNKMAFLSEYYLTKGDSLKLTNHTPSSKNEDSCLVNNDLNHTVNLNRYTKDAYIKNNTKNVAEDSSHDYHPSLSDYFDEGENLTPASVDKYHIAFIVHSNGCLLYANPSFLLLTGYKNIEEIKKAGGLDTLLEIQNVYKSGRPLGSVALYRSDCVSIAVSAHLHSIKWNGENSLAMTFVPFERKINFTQNISQTKTVEHNIEKSTPHKTEIDAIQLCSILEIASDGIAIIDADGNIISTNQAITDLFGYPQHDLLNKPLTKIFACENESMMSIYLSEIVFLDTGNKIKKSTVGRTIKGDLISIRVTIKKLPFSNCYCLIVHNISEFKQEKKDLYDNKKIVEKEKYTKIDLLARISHEIRTPLTAIIGFSEAIKNQKFGYVGNPRYVEYANYINQSSNLVLDIVNDLLDISKIESGQMNLSFQYLSLNDIISEAISLIQLYANDKRILVRTSFSRKIPQILADVRSIKQIALNILSNAIHFTPSGGQIIISTACTRNKSVVFRVRDTGIGMTNYELEKAMQPFGQIPNSEQACGEGTGLGLPITKAMVDANMGKFYVFSTPSKGTLVEIIFPIKKAS